MFPTRTIPIQISIRGHTTNIAMTSPTARLPGCLLVLCATLLVGCSASQRGESFQPVAINFAADEVGKPPRDFTTALTGGGGPIAWVVREDSKAPGGGKTLVQESADDTSYRFPLCLYDKVLARDVAVEVKFKAISGSVDQAGGIVLRTRRRTTTSPGQTRWKITSISSKRCKASEAKWPRSRSR